MPSNFWQFSETSPSSASTAISSQPITGDTNFGATPGGIIRGLDDFDALGIAAFLVGATGGTLDVSVEFSFDQGSTWIELIHFPQLANGAAAINYIAQLSLATTTTAPVVTGKNTSSALGANKIVSGAWGDRARLLMVAGSGTSAGASVVVQLMGQRSRLRETGA